MPTLMDGKAVSAKVRQSVLLETERLRENGIVVGIAVIIVGENPASQIYVRNKHRACESCGIESFSYELPEETTEQELLELIEKLNYDDRVDGILVQLPLPKQIDEKKIILAIRTDKDVDAFHPENVGRIVSGDYRFLPCTPAGVMTILDEYGIDPEGKHAVVIGRSNIVGKPQALLLLHKNATVTVCHSKTADLAEITRRADILVSAVGKAKFVKANMVKPGAVVVDVGMNRDEKGKLCGDVDFDEVAPIAGFITPVPGGVGPMTIATLMQNTLTAAKLHKCK